jgi:cation diffusion facilitator CzcD-associated flavoprotein CzcO
MPFSSKLLIIGAGPVGLAMARALKARGIAYDHVDAGPGVGGNWRHGLYSGVHIVSSKRSTAFADYPMPEDYPHFPSAAQMLAYIEAYAREHGLADKVEFNRTVTSARPMADDRWQVVLDGREQRIYKGVVVCNGHHRDPRMPSYPGTFEGEFIHAHHYREPSDLEGKRVLVIGGGNSGCDIASEAARVGAASHMSLRSGYWFLPKTVFGKPLTDLPIWNLPIVLQRLVLRGIVRLTIGDYRNYGLQWPSQKLFERHPTFGTEVLGYMAQGRIKPRAEVARFDGRTVHFVDGSSGQFDLVVAATGYHNSFPFLPTGLVEVKNDAAQIYGGAFPDKVKNLYIVGSNQPRNGFGNLITPAAALFARMIEMQDALEHPIGAILKWQREPLPETNLIDSGGAKRRIRLAWYLLPLLKLHNLQPWAGPPAEFLAANAALPENNTEPAGKAA